MGATVFEIGSVLMVVEAVNAERECSLSSSHPTPICVYDVLYLILARVVGAGLVDLVG